MMTTFRPGSQGEQPDADIVHNADERKGCRDHRQVSVSPGRSPAVKLSPRTEAMLAGELGPARRWAVEHQIQVGRMFDAADMIEVSQAHMMADPESIGLAGVELVERFAALPEGERRVAVPTITDPRGVDLDYYDPLGQTEAMADLERRFIRACRAMGIVMTNTCISYQIVMPPVRGDHVAYGDTGVVIYSNSFCGARSNFEGGPSALAAGLTGQTPRYGLHLDENRRATRRFVVATQPGELTEWGVLGAVVGRRAGSYWEVPVIEGIERAPTSDEAKHMGAAMASYGSTPLFHIVGITPECDPLADVEGADPAGRDRHRAGSGGVARRVRRARREGRRGRVRRSAALHRRDAARGDAVPGPAAPSGHGDAGVHRGRGVRGRARGGVHRRHRGVRRARAAGHLLLPAVRARDRRGQRLDAVCCRTPRRSVNILGGYGYEPALASMEACVDAAVAGRIV